MRSARLWFVVLLMSVAALVLHLRGDVDRVPPSRPLNEFPQTIGTRTATDIAMDPETMQILGKGDFLNRMYTPQPSPPGSTSKAIVDADQRASIGLFIGYFPTQRTGQSIHSPQITDGSSTQEVLYWYQMHGRVIAGDYEAKLYTLADSIRYDRTDAALVRIITPVEQGEDRLQSRARAVRFAEQIAPLLPAYVPD
jgi:hypothetical protein